MSCGFNQRRGGRFCCQVNVFIAVSGIAGMPSGVCAAVIVPLVVTVAGSALVGRSFANRCVAAFDLLQRFDIILPCLTQNH